mmetsp:Transcript_54703/g.100689  ORF Transcript_54703/g.100689 Transcript_54703/m.100689 type:complete len:884 (+) Transcript_54703:76-2727(+)
MAAEEHAAAQTAMESETAAVCGPPEPPPEPAPKPMGPHYKEYSDEIVRRLSSSQDGTGWVTGVADIGCEVAIWTTEDSPIKLRAAPLRFHMGWPGVPRAWQAAVKIMGWRETSRFEADAGDLRGPRGGEFENLIEGLPDDDEESVQFEIELRHRAEVVNVTAVDPSSLPKDKEDAEEEEEQDDGKDDESKKSEFKAMAADPPPEVEKPLGRFWVHLHAEDSAGRPPDFSHVSVHLRVRAVADAALDAVDGFSPRDDKLLLDTKDMGDTFHFTLENGASCPIIERVIRAMRTGDTATLLLSSGVLNMEDAVGEAAPFAIMRLPTRYDGALQIELSDLVFEDTDCYNALGLIAYAGKLRITGNELVKEKAYGRALGWYKRALKTLNRERAGQPIIQEGSDKFAEAQTAQVAILSNSALCCLQADDNYQALKFCKEALELDAGNAKVLFRKGKAFVALGEHANAVVEFSEAAKLEPKDTAIRNELEKARKNATEFKEKEQERYGGMFDEIQGFAAEKRPEEPPKENGLALAFPDDDDYGYKLICKLDENPYRENPRPNEDAERLQKEGHLEEAIWAWEAAISSRAAQGDWPMCYACWLELACLYLDLRADAVAVLCLERFLNPKDLPPAPKSLLRHAHLLCAICMLTQAGDGAKMAIERSLVAWLEAARADDLLAEEQQANQKKQGPGVLVMLAVEAIKESTALAMDACIGISILSLATNGSATDAANKLAQAISKPEVQGSFFGDPRRRAMKWNLMGAVLARDGRPEAAIMAYAKAVEGRQNYPRALVNMAAALSSRGKRKQAAAAYAHAAQTMPKSLAADVWKALGQVAAGMKEEEGSIDLVRAVVKHNAQEFLERLGTGLELPSVPDDPTAALKEIAAMQHVR